MAPTAIYNSFLLYCVEAKYLSPGFFIRIALELLYMSQRDIPRGVVRRESVGTAFPHLFHVLL